jgi:hypothetical protein
VRKKVSSPRPYSSRKISSLFSARGNIWFVPKLFRNSFARIFFYFYSCLYPGKEKEFITKKQHLTLYSSQNELPGQILFSTVTEGSSIRKKSYEEWRIKEVKE